VVADGSDVADGAALLQFSAQLTNDKALTSFHYKETRLGLDDQTREHRF
jgi:hypothetical protein